MKGYREIRKSLSYLRRPPDPLMVPFAKGVSHRAMPDATGAAPRARRSAQLADGIDRSQGWAEGSPLAILHSARTKSDFPQDELRPSRSHAPINSAPANRSSTHEGSNGD